MGKASRIITIETQGVGPIPDAKNFLEVSVTSVTLHLDAWGHGGCPIIYYFVIKYKKSGPESIEESVRLCGAWREFCSHGSESWNFVQLKSHG